MSHIRLLLMTEIGSVLSDAINPRDLRPGTTVRKNKKAIGTISDQEMQGILGVDLNTRRLTKSMFHGHVKPKYSGISDWINPRAHGDIY